MVVVVVVVVVVIVVVSSYGILSYYSILYMTFVGTPSLAEPSFWAFVQELLHLCHDPNMLVPYGRSALHALTAPSGIISVGPIGRQRANRQPSLEGNIRLSRYVG